MTNKKLNCSKGQITIKYERGIRLERQIQKKPPNPTLVDTIIKKMIQPGLSETFCMLRDVPQLIFLIELEKLEIFLALICPKRWACNENLNSIIASHQPYVDGNQSVVRLLAKCTSSRQFQCYRLWYDWNGHISKIVANRFNGH